METAPARRAGRPRSGESPLSRERILAAALARVDAHGLAALTMRGLAADLGVDPMSLYHHVPGKAALVTGLVETVFARLPDGPPPTEPWAERARSWARAYRALALRHPGLVLQIVSDPAAVSTAMRHASGPLYRALESADLPPDLATRAADTLVDFVHGHALAGTSGSDLDTAFETGLDIILAGMEALRPGR